MSNRDYQGRARGRHARAAAKLGARRRRERLFRAAGIAGLGVGLGFLASILIALLSQGSSAFTQTMLDLPVSYDPSVLGIEAADGETLTRANFDAVILGS